MAARASGASAFTWTDEGRDADGNLYSRQGRSGPVAAAFLIGPMSPSARGECRDQGSHDAARSGSLCVTHPRWRRKLPSPNPC
jgi:hypothetical protein